MSEIILYHGSPNKTIVPTFGLGNEKHDYGKGFYLTDRIDFAKEWAVCLPNAKNGWVHTYELELDGLALFDFEKNNILSWLAELMKHRDAADSKRYRMLSEKNLLTDMESIRLNSMSSKDGERMLLIFSLPRNLSGTMLISISLRNFFF